MSIRPRLPPSRHTARPGGGPRGRSPVGDPTAGCRRRQRLWQDRAARERQHVMDLRIESHGPEVPHGGAEAVFHTCEKVDLGMAFYTPTYGGVAMFGMAVHIAKVPTKCAAARRLLRRRGAAELPRWLPRPDLPGQRCLVRGRSPDARCRRGPVRAGRRRLDGRWRCSDPDRYPRPHLAERRLHRRVSARREGTAGRGLVRRFRLYSSIPGCLSRIELVTKGRRIAAESSRVRSILGQERWTLFAQRHHHVQRG